MFEIVVTAERKFLIFGPNNNYITITVTTINEVSNDYYKGNLDIYSLFQNDLMKGVKALKSSDQSDFINNISKIWGKIPESIKNTYKLLSEELKYILRRI